MSKERNFRMNNGDQPFNSAYEGFAPVENKNSAVAKASLVLGVFSIMLSFCCAGVASGIIAMVLAAVDRTEKGRFSAFSVAGLVCGVIGIIFGVAISVLSVFLSDALMEIAADPSYFNI